MAYKWQHVCRPGLEDNALTQCTKDACTPGVDPARACQRQAVRFAGSHAHKVPLGWALDPAWMGGAWHILTLACAAPQSGITPEQQHVQLTDWATLSDRCGP